MTWRQRAKYLYYAYRPFRGGLFPYFGTELHLPPRAPMLRFACEQGIYEFANVELLRQLARPGTWYFDVGGNLGFMSAPLLRHHADLRVAAFEVSPNSLPYLQRSRDGSPYRERWEIIPRAVGASEGTAEFSVSPLQQGFLDGLKATGRADGERTVKVPVTTLDAEWHRLGRPTVSILKIDIEGGEMPALRGGAELLRACRPHILTEWQPMNFKVYGTKVGDLLPFAEEFGYRVFSCPHLVPVRTPQELELQVLLTESFLLSAP